MLMLGGGLAHDPNPTADNFSDMKSSLGILAVVSSLPMFVLWLVAGEVEVRAK
jgi:hypothetical protein